MTFPIDLAMHNPMGCPLGPIGGTDSSMGAQSVTVHAAQGVDAPAQSVAVHTAAEEGLIGALRNLLSGEDFASFSQRHTTYGLKERFLHFISFGTAYSDVKAAYELEQSRAQSFSRAVCALQERLSTLEPGKEGSVLVMLDEVSIAITQNIHGQLTAQISTGDCSRSTEAFMLPFTAAALSNLMVGDMLARPEVYPKDALRNSIVSDLEVHNTPLRREVYEKVLSDRLGISSGEVANLSNLVLRRIAYAYLTGSLTSAKAARETVAHCLTCADYLQETCKINDEQATAIFENYTQALVSEAGQRRVQEHIDAASLTSPSTPTATATQADEAALAKQARNTRIHECMADLALNREAAVHDANLRAPGERLRATLIAHGDALVDILSGDEYVLDTLGLTAIDHEDPKTGLNPAEGFRTALYALQCHWRTSPHYTDNAQATKEEAIAFLNDLPAETLAEKEAVIDVAIDKLCTYLSKKVSAAVDKMRTRATLEDVREAVTKAVASIETLKAEFAEEEARQIAEEEAKYASTEQSLTREQKAAKEADIKAVRDKFNKQRLELMKPVCTQAIKTLMNAYGDTLHPLGTHKGALNKLIVSHPKLNSEAPWVIYFSFASDDYEALKGLSEGALADRIAKQVLTDFNNGELFFSFLSASLKKKEGNFDTFRGNEGNFAETMAVLASGAEDIRKDPSLDDMMQEAFDPNNGYTKLLLDVMEHYFDTDKVNAERGIDRRGMVASFFRYTRYDEGHDPSMGEVLGAVFKGAGPIMQKALQGLDASSLDPDFAQAIADMKSSLAPIDPAYVQAQCLDLVERSHGAITKITVNRSLGAASVGQAFLCDVTLKDGTIKPCVLKLLRPDVRNKAMRERALFEHYAKDTEGMPATFAGQLERILAELDLTAEADNAAIGKVYEDPDPEPDPTNPLAPPPAKRVCSMTVLTATPPAPGALLLERAPGSDLANVIKAAKAANEAAKAANEAAKAANEAAKAAQRAPSEEELQALAQRIDDLKAIHDRLCSFSGRWIDQAIFGAGFYHGDLHAGNIMVDAPDRATAPADAEVGPLTIIDYGNATSLSKEQRSAVMLMMAGATFKQPEWFQEAYLNLLSADGKNGFHEADTISKDSEGYLLDAEGLRVKNPDVPGTFIKLDADDRIEGTRKRPEGRITLMLKRVMTQGSALETAKRIAVALTLLQRHGIDCPGAIFNFSASQIRLQNAVDEVGAQIKLAQEALRIGTKLAVNKVSAQAEGTQTGVAQAGVAQTEATPEVAQAEVAQMEITPEVTQAEISPEAAQMEISPEAAQMEITPEVAQAGVTQAGVTPEAAIARLNARVTDRNKPPQDFVTMVGGVLAEHLGTFVLNIGPRRARVAQSIMHSPNFV